MNIVTFAPYLQTPYYTRFPDRIDGSEWTAEDQVEQERLEQDRFNVWQTKFEANPMVQQLLVPVVQLKTAARLARKFGHLWATLFGDQIATLNDEDQADLDSLERACQASDRFLPGINAPQLHQGALHHISASGRFQWTVFDDGAVTTCVNRPNGGSAVWLDFAPDGTVKHCAVGGGAVCLRRHVDAAISLLLAFMSPEEAEAFAAAHIVPYTTRVPANMRRTIDAAFFAGCTWTVIPVTPERIRYSFFLPGLGEIDDFITDDDPEIAALLAERFRHEPERIIDRLMPRAVMVNDDRSGTLYLLQPEREQRTDRPMPPTR